MNASHQPEEKKRKKEREFEIEPEVEEFHPKVKVDIEQQGDRPVRACRTQQGENACSYKMINFFARKHDATVQLL